MKRNSGPVLWHALQADQHIAEYQLLLWLVELMLALHYMENKGVLHVSHASLCM